MTMFKPSTWSISKIYRDIENYRDWIRTIKSESDNPKSKFNQWKLNHNFFYTIYFTHTVQEEESQLPERVMRVRMLESLGPLHRYLDEELGFAGCLVPEFNQFYDENGEPTLTYLIMYRFAFDKLSISWVLGFLLKVGLIIAAAFILKNYVDTEWIKGMF